MLYNKSISINDGLKFRIQKIFHSRALHWVQNKSYGPLFLQYKLPYIKMRTALFLTFCFDWIFCIIIKYYGLHLERFSQIFQTNPNLWKLCTFFLDPPMCNNHHRLAKDLMVANSPPKHPYPGQKLF